MDEVGESLETAREPESGWSNEEISEFISLLDEAQNERSSGAHDSSRSRRLNHDFGSSLEWSCSECGFRHASGASSSCSQCGSHHGLSHIRVSNSNDGRSTSAGAISGTAAVASSSNAETDEFIDGVYGRVTKQEVLAQLDALQNESSANSHTDSRCGFVLGHLDIIPQYVLKRYNDMGGKAV